MKCRDVIKSRQEYKQLIDNGLTDEQIAKLLVNNTFTELILGEWKDGEWIPGIDDYRKLG